MGCGIGCGRRMRWWLGERRWKVWYSSIIHIIDLRRMERMLHLILVPFWTFSFSFWVFHPHLSLRLLLHLLEIPSYSRTPTLCQMQIQPILLRMVPATNLLRQGY